MGPANAFRVIERVVCLTRRSVGREMELGNEVGNLQVIDVEIGVIVRDSFEVVDGPFTCDVI